MKETSLLTIGHSTHTLEAFVELLRAHGVEQLVDIRTLPGSRHNPQFNREALSQSLHNRRIGYRHMPALGGLRRARPDSVNIGWRNASFRGFADYMQTAPFEEALEALLALVAEKRTAIMCAEAVPWRCHRSLIADACLVRGVSVEHIMSETSRKPHTLSSWAHVEGKCLTYPAPEPAASTR